MSRNCVYSNIWGVGYSLILLVIWETTKLLHNSDTIKNSEIKECGCPFIYLFKNGYILIYDCLK